MVMKLPQILKELPACWSGAITQSQFAAFNSIHCLTINVAERRHEVDLHDNKASTKIDCPTSVTKHHPVNDVEATV
jgi:hypothetical protein